MIKHPKQKIRLFKLASIGQLKNEAKQKRALKKFGYRLDTDLTDRERVVAYNPTKNQTIFYERGTDPSNIADLATDVAVLSDSIKQTKRYDHSRAAMDAAHKKYAGSKFVDVGFSLGGNVVNYTGKSRDDIYTINAGFAPTSKAKPRDNVLHLRVAGDPISSGTPAANTQVVKSDIRSLDPLAKHYLPNIKDVPIFL